MSMGLQGLISFEGCEILCKEKEEKERERLEEKNEFAKRKAKEISKKGCKDEQRDQMNQ